MQLTPRAKRVIDLAYDEARQLNNNYIGTEHLLLGLIREGEGLAGKVLTMLGADLDRARSEVQLLQAGKSAEKVDDGPALDAAPHTALDDFKKAMMAFVASYRSPKEAGPQAGETGTVSGPEAAAPAPPAAPVSPSQRMAPTRGRSALAGVLEEPRLRRRDILGIEGLTRDELLLISRRRRPAQGRQVRRDPDAVRQGADISDAVRKALAADPRHL